MATQSITRRNPPVADKIAVPLTNERLQPATPGADAAAADKRWCYMTCEKDEWGAARDQTKEALEKKQLLFAFVGMTLLTLAIALIAGMVLNDKYFGSATGGGDAEGTAEEQDETAGNIDALKIFCCSWAVAMVLAMARLLVIWKVNGRYRRIYNFVVFLVLSFAVLDLSWSLVGERQIAVLEPASPAMISQITSVLGSASTDDNDYLGITDSQGFYNWMNERVKPLMTAGARNRNTTKKANVLAPFLFTSDWGGDASNGILSINTVSLRQVRASLDEFDESQHLTVQYFNSARNGSTVYVKNKVSECCGNSDERDTSARSFPNSDANCTEIYTEEKVSNTYGKSLNVAGDMLSMRTSGRTYPSAGGMRLNCQTESLSDDVFYHMHYGQWYPMLVSGKDATHFTDAVSSDIQFMQDNAWIDQQTALVEVMVGIWNPNNNLLGQLFFSIEFENDGSVTPNTVSASVSYNRLQHPSTVSVVLVWAFYYIAVEVQELADTEVESGVQFSSSTGFYEKLIDFGAIIFALIAYSYGMEAYGYLPDANEFDLHPYALVLEEYQMYLALANFLIIMKGMKWLFELPYFSVLKDVVSLMAMDILAFFVLVVIFMFAFANLFFTAFSIHLTQFRTMRDTWRTLFNSLLGQFNADDIFNFSPHFGTTSYVAYQVIVYFICFSMLIGLISSGYERVRPELNVTPKADKDSLAMTILAQLNIFYKRMRQSANVKEEYAEVPLFGLAAERQSQMEGAGAEAASAEAGTPEALLQDLATQMADVQQKMTQLAEALSSNTPTQQLSDNNTTKVANPLTSKKSQDEDEPAPTVLV